MLIYFKQMKLLSKTIPIFNIIHLKIVWTHLIIICDLFYLTG